MKIILALFLSVLLTTAFCQEQQTRWNLNDSGGISRFLTETEYFSDHMEMSGKQISAVVHYGVDEKGTFFIKRELVWPMLRTIPNNTHASLIRSFQIDPVKLIHINSAGFRQEQVKEIRIEGKIIVHSVLNNQLSIERTFFPSVDLPVFVEKYKLTNIINQPLIIEIPRVAISQHTHESMGTEGIYNLKVQSHFDGTTVLLPGQSNVFYLSFSGHKLNQPISGFDPGHELFKRDSLLQLFQSSLILETPDPVLNRMFSFAKIRAAESIYETKGGPMHGPGGLRYYAAIWANDQAEYINPFFPFLGYDYGIQSAINSFRHFAHFTNPEYNPIPSSIIAEGTDIWNGAGDRGDAAMIAYGAGRFALSLGSKKTAKELWPLIEWCLEFNQRKLNTHGVVNSDSDELEGRFPAGEANLNTSCLYYDALISAAFLAEDLNINRRQINNYREKAALLKNNIEKYFGANIMGYETYRYYAENEVLRAWICTPLTVNIFNRKQGTIDALFSPQLWTPNGLASVSGDTTFWDRATLYGLRGVFAAGDTKRGLAFLKKYSTRRLLGEHVPYAVEAYPEGNQRHLSAESGLYCRIFTEGLFGIRPVSLNGFSLTPQLPEDWNEMKIRKIHGFQHIFDIEVHRETKKIRLIVKTEKTTVFNQLIDNGISVQVYFKN
ncbi:MAG: hypothetical protein EOM06_00800 [Sphingobacteriia bacterium]|nr:hypothetical protein [Sphingobacteriia bacterium]